MGAPPASSWARQTRHARRSELTPDAQRLYSAQQPAELGDVPARDRDRLPVAEGQLGGPAEPWTQLDRAVEVGHVLAVHADEPVTAPSGVRSRSAWRAADSDRPRSTIRTKSPCDWTYRIEPRAISRVDPLRTFATAIISRLGWGMRGVVRAASDGVALGCVDGRRHPLERLLEPAAPDGLEQVVERVELERLDGGALVRADEHELRARWRSAAARGRARGRRDRASARRERSRRSAAPRP